MINKNKIIIASGGTGGHVFPSISLANFLSKDFQVEIFTDERGIKYLKNNKNLKIKKIMTDRVFSKNIFSALVGIIKVFFSIISSLKILFKLKPKLVIGMGGYSSFAVCLSGYFLNIPVIIYENNLIIGRANRFLLPFSKKILVSSNNIQGIQNKYKHKIFFTGFLLRREILETNKKDLDISKNNLSLLIMGGSQSAEFFGDQIPKIIQKCDDQDIKFNIYQQCLNSQKEKIKNIYQKLNINFELFNFTDDLSKYYKKCDIAITRCGASSMAELVNLNIPFIAIPLPTSMDNHQYKNAKYFENKGYCFLLDQKYLQEKLLNMLKNINQHRDKLNLIKKKMSEHSDKNTLLLSKQIITKIING